MSHGTPAFCSTSLHLGTWLGSSQACSVHIALPDHPVDPSPGRTKSVNLSSSLAIASVASGASLSSATPQYRCTSAPALPKSHTCEPSAYLPSNVLKSNAIATLLPPHRLPRLPPPHLQPGNTLAPRTQHSQQPLHTLQTTKNAACSSARLPRGSPCNTVGPPLPAAALAPLVATLHPPHHQTSPAGCCPRRQATGPRASPARIHPPVAASPTRHHPLHTTPYTDSPA